MLRELIVRVLAGIGALYLLVTFTPIDNWWINRLTGPIYNPKGDILVLLGAEAFKDAIGYESYWRALYGLRFWRSGGFREIFISAGPGIEGVPASTQMRDFMISQGVPAAAIQVETRSISTRENALFTKEALQNTPGRIVLLTSDFHTFRAYRAFRKVGMDVESCSFPDQYKMIHQYRYRWGVFLTLCEETTKIGYYYVRGWI